MEEEKRIILHDVVFVCENFKTVAFNGPDDLHELHLSKVIQYRPKRETLEKQNVSGVFSFLNDLEFVTTKKRFYAEGLQNVDPKNITGAFIGDAFYYIADPEIRIETSGDKIRFCCHKGDAPDLSELEEIDENHP